MKLLPCLLLLLLTEPNSFAQILNMNQGGPAVKNYYVQLSYQTINGKIFVFTTIAGKTHKFLLDTGAPVAISPALAAEINATPMRNVESRDVNGNLDSVPVALVNEIKIGDLSFTNIPAMVFIPDFYACWNIDGVIGSNMLRKSIIIFNSEQHTIIITDQPEKLSFNKKHAIPMLANTLNDYQSMHFITIKLQNKVNLTLEFDTGDNAFLRFSDDFMNQLAQFNVYQIALKGYGASTIGELGLQANANKYLLKIPFLNIGSARFNNVQTLTNKGGIPGLGSKLLDYGNVTLDFINGKFYFDAKNELIDVNEKQWPFEPTFNNDKLVIGLIWERAMKQVKTGEQIVAIDGKDYSHVNFCDLLNSPPALTGKTSATITIRDKQGKNRNIEIVKE